MQRFFVWAVCALFLCSACSFKPVRHLASDAALIKAGEASRQDVLRYLGKPDDKRSLAPGTEEYVYSEYRKGQLGNLPMLGKLISPVSQELVVVTLKGDKVVNCEYRLIRKDDKEWKEDVSWEDVK